MVMFVKVPIMGFWRVCGERGSCRGDVVMLRIGPYGLANAYLLRLTLSLKLVTLILFMPQI